MENFDFNPNRDNKSELLKPESVVDHINSLEDPDQLQEILAALQERIKSISNNIDNNSSQEDSGNNIIQEKHNRLKEITNGITELSDRMQKPYIASAELIAIKQVLDILSEKGECNSVILEGDPGTGKTQWAYSEVGQMIQDGIDACLVHIRVKDTMSAQDLLYTVDDVKRLSDAQSSVQVPPEIQKEASAWKDRIIKEGVNIIKSEEYKAFTEKMEAVIRLSEVAKDLDYSNYIKLGPLGEAIVQSREGKKVWLLVDEIEKGREELMTGILDEIENLNFHITETGEMVQGDKKNLRIVVTTNPEDSDKIPASFRRRCLYHYMDMPNRRDLAEIVNHNFPGINDELVKYALDIFDRYRKHPNIEKKPSTPELLSWVQVLLVEGDGIPEGVPHKEILLKTKEDKELELSDMSGGADESAKERSGVMPRAFQRAFEGYTVMTMDPDINDYYRQDSFGNLYAKLDKSKIGFSTPEFETVEVRDSYGNQEEEEKNTKHFQIIAPGVADLGEGYFEVPNSFLEGTGLDLKDIFEKKILVISDSDLPEFDSVKSRDRYFTKGRVTFNGSWCEAYRIEDKGKTKMAILTGIN